MIMTLGFVSSVYALFGSLACLDALRLKPGWRGKALELPRRQGILPSLRTGGPGRGQMEEQEGKGRWKWKF